jgi:hypothetical protein
VLQGSVAMCRCTRGGGRAVVMGCPGREVSVRSGVCRLISLCGSVLQVPLGGASEEVRVSRLGGAKPSDVVGAMGHNPVSWSEYNAVALSSLEQ